MTRVAGSALVLFPGALGDAVCLEPAIAWLAASGPVTLYARGGAAEVAHLFPSPLVVRSLDAVEVARLFSPADDPRTAAWLGGFARIVSFTGAGVPVVEQRMHATGRGVLVRFPRPPLAEHAVDLFLRAVGGTAPSARATPRLVLDTATEQRHARPLLALLPGSGGRTKRAPAQVYAALAGRWRRRGGDVGIVLGPAEGAEDDAWRAFGTVARPSSVEELGGLLAGAVAFVGNDAGTSHVAAALGTAGVVLYSSTAPAAFGPRGAQVAAVQLEHGVEAAIDATWQVLRGRLP